MLKIFSVDAELKDGICIDLSSELKLKEMEIRAPEDVDNLEIAAEAAAPWSFQDHMIHQIEDRRDFVHFHHVLTAAENTDADDACFKYTLFKYDFMLEYAQKQASSSLLARIKHHAKTHPLDDTPFYGLSPYHFPSELQMIRRFSRHRYFIDHELLRRKDILHYVPNIFWARYLNIYSEIRADHIWMDEKKPWNIERYYLVYENFILHHEEFITQFIHHFIASDVTTYLMQALRMRYKD